MGTYPYFGNQVPFSLMIMDGAYFLMSEGMTIPMTRTNTGINTTEGELTVARTSESNDGLLNLSTANNTQYNYENNSYLYSIATPNYNLSSQKPTSSTTPLFQSIQAYTAHTTQLH